MPNPDYRHDLQENLQENIHDLQQELLQMQEELNKRLEELRTGKFSFRVYTREHPYMLLFLYLPVYLVWFFLQEYHLSSTDGCFVSYLPLDDQIPFLPGFIFPYITWYVYLLIPAVIFLVKEDGPAFLRYALFIILGFSGSLLFCTLFPNCQLLRADLSDPQNLSEFLVAAIYGADTPTNVLPSMHVVGCIGVMVAAFDGFATAAGFSSSGASPSASPPSLSSSIPSWISLQALAMELSSGCCSMCCCTSRWIGSAGSN